jgi:chemotaxis protein CheC
MADMLHISLNSSLPDYRIASTEDIFNSLKSSQEQPYILVLHIDLSIEKRHSEGHLIFLLSSMSLHSLVQQLEVFLGKIA